MEMNGEKPVILISACLLGINCRYDGKSKEAPGVLELLKDYHLVPVCPEALGGLVSPRPPAEIHGGDGADVLAGRARVLNKNGGDCTGAFIRGARKILEMAGEHRPRYVVLKANSPSCGVGAIYDGTFSRQLTVGDGVTTALLKEHGWQVLTEEDILKTVDPRKVI